MTLHQNIKEQIKDAMRAHDQIKLDTLRGLNALFLNEMLTIPTKGKVSKKPAGEEFLPDEMVLVLIKRSVKQRKDSIEQFTKGGRKDLADKEKKELAILESFLPASMSKDDIKKVVLKEISALKKDGSFDPKSIGKITGLMMKEFAGKADGADVKAVVEEVVKG